MTRRPFTVIPSLIAAVACSMASATESLVYFGTYTTTTSKGIYVSKFDDASGKLSKPALAAETPSPSFLEIHPTKKFLVAANENGTPENAKGAVSSFALDPGTGKLTFLNQQTTTGAGPCFVSIDPTGKEVLAANYGGGSVVSYSMAPDGKLGSPASFFQHEGAGLNAQRQEGPHAHSINLSPNGQLAWACDLGLDRIFTYRVLSNLGTLAPAEPPFVQLKAGSGPRHFALHPDGKWAYVINELNSTITMLTIDAKTGALNASATVSTLPKDFAGSNTTAHVAVHPNGRFVYGSNRGHDSIAVFAVDKTTGWLRLVNHTPTEGKTPRNFAIHPSGKWLIAANQDTNTVVVFKIDPESGRLTSTGQAFEIGKPVCVKFFAP